MAKLTTDFRQEIDSFVFTNDWNPDDVEKKAIRAIIDQCLPAAAGILTPIALAISPLVLATLGPAVSLLGAVPPFFAPLIIRYLLDQLTDVLADASMGRCDGMAYSTVDYHRLQWVLPRGKDKASNILPQHIQSMGTQGSDSLRQYIWDRQLDSLLGNGAKFLVWIAMDQLFASYGQGWLRDRTLEEMQVLKSKIAQGLPWPIGLIASSSNPTNSHAVTAIGYEEVALNQYHVEVNDNNFPGKTMILEVDLSGPWASIREFASTDTGPAHKYVEKWSGLFCTNYAAKRPRPAVVATSPLTLNPPLFGSQGKQIQATFSILNQGFEATLPLHLAVGENGWAAGEDSSQTPVLVEGQQVQPPKPFAFRLNQPMTYNLQPMVALAANTPNPSYKILPTAGGIDFMPSIFIVTPIIQISAISQNTNSCVYPFVEGNTIKFHADTSAVAGVGIKGFQWQVSVENPGQAVTISFDPILTLGPLPKAGTKLLIDLTITLNDGTEALGHTQLTTKDTAMAQTYEKLCEIAHIAVTIPGLGLSRLKPATDPVPDWSSNAAVKKILNPQTLARQYAVAAKEITKIAQQPPLSRSEITGATRRRSG